MKKIYLFGLSLVAISAVNGQIQKNYEAKKMNTIGEKAPKVSFSQTKAIPFFTNDFSDETQWVTANFPAGTPPHTDGDWVVTNGVVNFPVSALNPAGFATAANGYAWINSDMNNNGAGESQNADIRFNSNIDCSTHPTVNFKFSHITRHFQETYYVIVSNDGGNTWTEFQVNEDQAVNTNSANPGFIQVNITSVAGGQDSVRIGFRYKGAFDWFWAVDDVELSELEPNDLTLRSVYWGTEGSFGARLPYYKTPLSQVSEINFSGVVKNNGSLDQSVTFNLNIPSASFNETSSPFVSTVSSVDTLDLNLGFTPTANGVFTFSSAISNGTDANPSDNSLPNVTFDVNNYIYSRNPSLTPTTGLFNEGNPYVFGNIYDIFQNANATAIRAYIANTSVVGSLFSYRIYEIDDQGDFVLISGAETELKELEQANLGSYVTLAFDSPVPLVANNPYLIAISTPGSGGTSDDIVLGSNGVSETQTVFWYNGANATWFTSTATPMIDLIFDPSITAAQNSLAELNEFALSIYPNPANEEVKVSFNLNGASSASVNVIDMTGKVVASQEATAGSNAVSINTANLSAGVYTVSFTANNTTVTKKLVVKK